MREYTCETGAAIPSQWELLARDGALSDSASRRPTYEVRDGDGERFTYLCGMEDDRVCELPRKWNRIVVPDQSYTVFTWHGHVSAIRSVWNTIWNEWFARLEYESSGGPDFERYGTDFNPVTGTGGFEVWVPIRV